MEIPAFLYTWSLLERLGAIWMVETFIDINDVGSLETTHRLIALIV